MDSTYDSLLSLMKVSPAAAGAASLSKKQGTSTYDRLLLLMNPQHPTAIPTSHNKTYSAPALDAANLQVFASMLNPPLSQRTKASDVLPGDPVPASPEQAFRAVDKQNMIDNSLKKVLSDPKQAATYTAALYGLPFSGFSQDDVDQMSDQIYNLQLTDDNGYLNPDGTTTYTDNSPAIEALTKRRDDMQSSLDRQKANYMAQPAAWTDSEKQAIELKQQDKWAYQDYITSNQYLSDNWDHWMELVQTGRILSTEQREQAKMAAEALGKVAENLYFSHGNPMLLTADEQKLYNTLTGLSGMLESKYSKGEAAILGAANVLPIEAISSQLRKYIPGFAEYQDSRYSDPQVADLMAKGNMSENAQAANPGYYKGANIAANVAAMAAGSAGLAQLGIKGALKDAILFGTPAGIHSAANQDWSHPGQAALNTLGDTAIGAAGGVAAGKLFENFAKAIAEEWNSVYKPTATKWPETMDDLLKTGYTEGAGDVINSSEITSIYRAVGPQEYYSVLDSGKFSKIPQALQAKQFGVDLQDTINFAERYSDIAAVLEVKIPKTILDKVGDFTHVDTRIFKNGTISIQPYNLDEFNKYIKEILHIY